jgi:NAD(P)-dependent dehydrogenase (short-subunit alcohol dehydrogenase family)
MKRTIFITGSTDGIGKLAAIKLAKEGHEVYIHGRNPDKVTTVIAEIKKEVAYAEVKGFTADLSDMKAVKQLAQDVKETLPKLDVLINNAGVYKSAVAHNQDGLDMRMVVNYLAPYVLTNELMPWLRKGNKPRIINLSSAAQSPVSHKLLMGKEQASDSNAYAQSKLALTMWSFDLAQATQDVQVIAVNPGSLLNTNMVKEAYGNHWSSADKGANILYDLAVLADYEGVTGKYFDNDQGVFGKAHPDAYSQTAIDNLRHTTEDILN